MEISNLVENRDELVIQISTSSNHQEETENSMQELLMAKQDLELSKQELENNIAFARTVKENLETEMQSVLRKLDQNKLINTRLASARERQERENTYYLEVYQ